MDPTYFIIHVMNNENKQWIKKDEKKQTILLWEGCFETFFSYTVTLQCAVESKSCVLFLHHDFLWHKKSPSFAISRYASNMFEKFLHQWLLN